jgi:uncharacterized membrane protein YccC
VSTRNAIGHVGREQPLDMSALRAAQARADSALERIERALRARIPGGGAAQECERLRQELAAANERAERLRELVVQAEERIDDTIDRVDELAAGTTP